mmetsp:Transcript_50777/g.110899  ORF Transcript_50777/g.110899 Transcript_50777/m.110899 type:complete len:257 (+) Transcript_50777:1253-2023(+)
MSLSPKFARAQISVCALSLLRSSLIWPSHVALDKDHLVIRLSEPPAKMLSSPKAATLSTRSWPTLRRRSWTRPPPEPPSREKTRTEPSSQAAKTRPPPPQSAQTGPPPEDNDSRASRVARSHSVISPLRPAENKRLRGCSSPVIAQTKLRMERVERPGDESRSCHVKQSQSSTAPLARPTASSGPGTSNAPPSSVSTAAALGNVGATARASMPTGDHSQSRVLSSSMPHTPPGPEAGSSDGGEHPARPPPRVGKRA